jgi:ABC-type microcin C transport system permease subunit YejB
MFDNRFVLPFTVTNPTTAPFLQLATPTTCGLLIVEFVIGQEAGEVSEQVIIQFQRRTTASTLPTAASINALNQPGNTARLASSTTTNAYGIASATGTAGALLDQYPFHVSNGERVIPVPLAVIDMDVSQFLTVQFKTAPGANIYTGHIKVQER